MGLMLAVRNRSAGNGTALLLVMASAAAAAIVGGLMGWWFWTKLTSEKKDLVDSDDDDDDNNNNNYLTSERLPLPTHLKREMAKEARRKKLIPFFTMKRPMYDNIFMFDPEGNKLCTISKKKADWYVKKDLAGWKDQKYSSIQLKFGPKNSHKEKDPRQEVYNKTAKQNICVVCGAGAKEGYMRHYVVPYRYRTQFPTAYKTHLPHDVVLTCPDCHVEAERSAHHRMRRLERDLRRRMLNDTTFATETPFFIDGRVHKIISSAQALLKWKHKLPQARIQEYTKLLQEWAATTSNNNLTEEQLYVAATELDDKIPNPKYISGPDLVLQWLLQGDKGDGHNGKDKERGVDAKFSNFIVSWRQHFIETMLPRHLPTGWSIDSPIRCDARRDEQQDEPSLTDKLL